MRKHAKEEARGAKDLCRHVGSARRRGERARASRVGEGDALGYACSCTLAGCTLDDMPEVAAAAGVTLEPSSDGR